MNKIIFTGCWDTKEISVPDMFKGMILALEVGSFEPRTQILGGVAIVDLEDIGTQHAWQATPAVAAKIVKMLVVSTTVIISLYLRTVTYSDF